MTTNIVFVAEAWGDRELQFKHALVGPSGREFARMLAAADIAPEVKSPYPSELDMIAHWKRLEREHGIVVTNVFNTHPPGNDIEAFFSPDGNRDVPQLKARRFILPEYMPHLIRLWDQINSLKPNVVVALGNVACWAILGETKITALRGTVKVSPRLGVKCLPTFHPAAVLRQWSMRPTVLADLKKAGRESKYPEVRRTERWITIPSPDHAGILEITQWLNRQASFYANDIETEIGQISMLSFARSKSEALVIPFLLTNSQKIPSSFWPTDELEVSAWKLAIRGLKRAVPKIGQNYLYDMSYYARMGILPAMPREDTMLRHHAMYPELQKGLGFLGSIYCDEVSWKLMSNRHTLKRDE